MQNVRPNPIRNAAWFIFTPNMSVAAENNIKVKLAHVAGKTIYCIGAEFKDVALLHKMSPAVEYHVRTRWPKGTVTLN